MFKKIVNKVRPSSNGWQQVTIKHNSQYSKCTLSENETKKAPKVSKWPNWASKKHCNTRFGCGFPSTVENLAESSNSEDFSTFGTFKYHKKIIFWFWHNLLVLWICKFHNTCSLFNAICFMFFIASFS